MVPLHVDHNEKKSKMMWHIKLKETRCVPLSACSFVSFPGVVHREDTLASRRRSASCNLAARNERP